MLIPSLFKNRVICGLLGTLCLLGTILEVVLNFHIAFVPLYQNISENCSSEHSGSGSSSIEQGITDDECLLNNDENLHKSFSGPVKWILNAGNVIFYFYYFVLGWSRNICDKII